MRDYYNKVLMPHLRKAEELYESEESKLEYVIDFRAMDEEIKDLLKTACYDAADYATPWYKDQLMKEIWSLNQYQSVGLRKEGEYIVIEEDCEPDIISIGFTVNWNKEYKLFRSEFDRAGLLLGLLVSMLSESDDYYAKMEIINGRIDCWFSVFAIYGS